MANPEPRNGVLLLLATLVLAGSGLLYFAMVNFLSLRELSTRQNDQIVEFVVLRAYHDASRELGEQSLRFMTPTTATQSVQIGLIKLVVEPQPVNSISVSKTTNFNEYNEIYNWHKSRAAFRRLEQRVQPELGTSLLNELERLGVLTHPRRLAVQGKEVLDPY